MKTWELTIYADGVAILTDPRGNTHWTSDDDDEFAEEFPDVLSFEDGDEILDYLTGCGIVPEDVEVDIVETDDTGLNAVLEGDEDEDPDEDEDDGDTLQ